MQSVALPQARIALGWVMVNGVNTPVTIDQEWMRALFNLVQRSGGVSGDEGLGEFVSLLFGSPQTDPAAQEAIRAVDELRHEVASARNDLQTLRGLVEELSAAAAAPTTAHDLRARVQEIEDRLQ